jgi:hypothetical protein
VEQIRAVEVQLRHNGQKAVVVIATDGESSDGDIKEALRPLAALPVWTVIRLCTGEEKIVNYWNDSDNELELEMEVLDDFFSEAAEVHSMNGWLTYGEPLHRIREWGVHLKELDWIDEKPLSFEMMSHLCTTMYVHLFIC